MLGVFFQQTINDAGLQVMGLFLAMFGLVLFLDGLRVSLIPLSELVGQQLPKRLHLFFVLLTAGLLGILVTYAEPAIASLKPLAELVDPREAAYLYFIMNQQQEMMVFAIGAGVGVAAVIGTLRFIRNWPLKPLIVISLLPTIGLACYMQWGNPSLAPVIGMAWDCGGVTTGPVTVPVLLSLGIGVMRSARQRRLAQAALDTSVAAGAGQSLEGFGIVTLASLWPIFAVELMAVIDGAIYSEEYVTQQAIDASLKTDTDSPIDSSPVKEVVYAIRAILPLYVFLILIVVVVLRVPLPVCTFWVDPPDEDVSVNGSEPTNLSRASVAISDGLELGLERHPSMQSMDSDSGHGGTKALAALQEDSAQEGGGAARAGEEGKRKRLHSCCSSCWTGTGKWFRDNAPFLGGIAITQIGMIAFNEGLTYSFTKLGDQTGLTLPAAFMSLPDFPKSPYYSYAAGLTIVFIAIFFLGVLATRAEPALNVLGRTVERLSGRAFTCRMLIGSVCLGVGVGLAAGAAKIIFSLPIIYFILGKYAIAVGLMFISQEAIAAVAYDSAGVTTGPVTVPFVLSIGIGLSTAVDSPEGFGMLTIASVAPIISVLLMNLIRKPVKTAQRQLSMKARALGRSVTNLRTMKSMKRSPSSAMAAFAANAGNSATTTPDTSTHSGVSGLTSLNSQTTLLPPEDST